MSSDGKKWTNGQREVTCQQSEIISRIVLRTGFDNWRGHDSFFWSRSYWLKGRQLPWRRQEKRNRRRRTCGVNNAIWIIDRALLADSLFDVRDWGGGQQQQHQQQKRKKLTFRTTPISVLFLNVQPTLYIVACIHTHWGFVVWSDVFWKTSQDFI